jgi:hypothetical protein
MSFEYARGARLLREWDEDELADRYEARLRDSSCICLDSLATK